jgi:RNA polymerase sigma-70 factor (ECF subfamily)
MSASPYNAGSGPDSPGPDARGNGSANGKDSAVPMLQSAPRIDGNGDDGTYGRPHRSLPPGEQTDEQLLSDYRQGDKSAFAKLVNRYQRELYHFLVRFLGNRASAEDVFQETFLQVHQSAEQFDPQRRFRPWLFTIAANKARDLIRSQARRPTNPLQASISPGDNESGEFIDLMQSTDDLPSDPMEKRELQEQVHNTVTSMPEHLREILLLSYFHQFPYKQISEILDIPLGTVKSRLHAAVAHFADRWRAANQKKSMA